MPTVSMRASGGANVPSALRPWPLTQETGIFSANCKRGIGVNVPSKSPVN